jgi:ribosomal protein L29
VEEKRKQGVPQALRDNLTELEAQRDHLKATFQLIQLRAQNAKADLDAVEEKIRQTRKLIADLEGGETLAPTLEYTHMKLIDAAVNYLTKVGGGPISVPDELAPALIERGAKLGYGTAKEKPLAEAGEPGGAFRQLTQTFTRNPGRVIYDSQTETVRLSQVKVLG